MIRVLNICGKLLYIIWKINIGFSGSALTCMYIYIFWDRNVSGQSSAAV